MLPSVRPSIRRAVLGLTSVALLSGTLVAGPAATAAPDDRPTGRAKAAADWLVDQLNPNDLVLSGFVDENGTFVRFIDHGLTLDVYFALKDLGVARERREGILDALETRVDDYVTFSGKTAAGSRSRRRPSSPPSRPGTVLATAGERSARV